MTKTRRKQGKRPKAQPPPTGWLWVARTLIALAVLGSLYLSWAALGGERLPGCGPESGCDEVLSSRWARLFGMPVAAGALLVYGALGITAGKAPAPGSVRLQLGFRSVTLFSALLTLLAAAWFVGVQVFVVGAVCVYCMSVHTCASTAAWLILIKLPLIRPRGRTGQAGDGALLSRRAVAATVAAALLAVVLLGLGQSLHQPAAFVSRGVSGGAKLGSTSAPKGSVAPATGGRVLRLYGGAFEFDLTEVPYAGSADAQHVVVSLFDYTCRHCRVLHGFLEEARRTFGNQLGIMSLPVPLDPACNALVTRPLADHTNACVYARIGLAVWRANRGQSEAFDHWMFTPAWPPTPEAARQHAMSLVGAEAFAQASEDPWIERQLAQSTRLFATNYLESRISRLPQLFIGADIVVGDFRRVEALNQMLATKLNLVPLGPVVP